MCPYKISRQLRFAYQSRDKPNGASELQTIHRTGLFVLALSKKKMLPAQGSMEPFFSLKNCFSFIFYCLSVNRIQGSHLVLI